MSTLYRLRSGALACILFVASSPLLAQRTAVISKFEQTGRIASVQEGQIAIVHPDSSRRDYKIQDKTAESVLLDGGKLLLNHPAKISVRGKIPANLAAPGMVLAFQARVNRTGELESQVANFQVLAEAQAPLGIRFESDSQGNDFKACRITAKLSQTADDQLTFEVPASASLKTQQLTVPLTDNAMLEIDSDDLQLVCVGDQVNRMKGVELSTGDYVVSEIDIALTAVKRKTTLSSYQAKLEQKFRHLSNEPLGPRQTNSDHFLLNTDLSERSAAILLDKLETMHDLLGQYFGRRTPAPIECYVVRDLKNWQGKLPEVAIRKIQSRVGVTTSRTRGRVTKAVVYACDKHEVVQHEAVHAFCYQVFGDTGPVWYSEGIAEIGKYWNPDDVAINIKPMTMDYLANSPPKPLDEIVKVNQVTSDSWQAYAWRWALCQLLIKNPNYSTRFQRLGINLMLGKNDSFEKAFKNVADRMQFEYEQFIENIGNGYRVDLCAWDWQTQGKPIVGDGRVRMNIKAAAGWQASGLTVEAGVSYDYIAQGSWKITTEGELSADGDEQQQGRLIGVVLKDYQLIHAIKLGKNGSFQVPVDGHLFLRCHDRWTELSDNAGEIKVFFRRTPAE